MLATILVVAALHAAQAPSVDEIPSPREWVAFSADLRGTDPTGRVEGKFYRGADGSTRKETGPVGGPIDNIVIVNLARGEQYTCRKTCVSKSITKPETPPRMRKSLPGLTKLDTAVEGFEAYVWQSGVVSTVIPALNFFAVEMNSPRLSEKYSNVRVGEQAAGLFQPPPQLVNR
jgi:hypothetical protein